MALIKTPIIKQIESCVETVPGWLPLDQLYTLFNLVYLTSGLEGDIVEIGSWCGRSSSILGMAAQLAGNTKVFCVDLFPAKEDWKQNADGSYSMRVQIGDRIYGAYQDQTVWQEPFERDIAPIYEQYNSVFDVFQNTIAERNLQNTVSSFRGDFAQFSASLKEDFRCRVAFLDGDHSYDAVCQDITTVEKYLVPGGWICFDDAFSHYDGVNQAIEDLIIQNPNYELCQQMTRKFFMARKRSQSL